MISKEQYIEIIDAFEKYTKLYTKIFNKPMSEEYQQGMARALDIIESLVKKD